MFIRTPANGSRVDAAGAWSKLDYICSTARATSAERYEHLSSSDHSPIGCQITAPVNRRIKKTAWRVSKKLSALEIAHILQESAWPLKQMNRDPITKQAMVKVSLEKRPAAGIRRIQKALHDPSVSTEEFKEMVLTASKTDFKSLLHEMHDAQFVN